MKTELIQLLVFGGDGIQGIAQTPFYNFISSPDGLSQLGIRPQDPPRLLEAYEKTFKVSKNRTTLLLRFGDVSMLELFTPHPRAGKGGLKIRSWMQFVTDDVQSSFGYVPRKDLPKSSQEDIALGSPLGGLMFPRGLFGSTGHWEFPNQFQNYDVKWLKDNRRRLQTLIASKLRKFLSSRLK